MEFAVFLFMMAILSALKAYWIYILVVVLLFSGTGCWHSCRKGCCPKKGAWQGCRLAILVLAILIPVLITALMAL